MGRDPSPGASRRSDRALLLIGLPLMLSTLLLVLFSVVLNRQQEQVHQVSDLLQRVQRLENRRAIERAAVLEQQIQSMLARLVTLEKGGQALSQRQQQQQQVLQELVQDLQRWRSSELTAEPDLSDTPVVPRRRPAPRPAPAPASPAQP